MSEGHALQRLARVPLLQRLATRGKPPLRLVAVARDHVTGNKAAGEQLLGGRFVAGAEAMDLAELDWSALGTSSPLAVELHGFSWLRDLAAATTREKGAALAEGLAARWLATHGEKIDPAWAPALWGERLLFWLAYAPYLLSRRDAAYRKALLNTMARAARHLASVGDEASPGLPRITAWAGLTASCLLLSSGTARLARAEGGLARALASAQHDDGGLMSRSPAEQAMLVDRLGLLRSAYAAARHDFPQGFEDAGAAALAALHGVTMGDGTLSSWQGGNEGSRAELAAIVEGCGFRARPLRVPRGWGYHRLSALGTALVIDAAPPPGAKLARVGSASTLAIELSDGQQKLVVNCGGAGRLAGSLPEGLAEALRTTAAHSTLTLADTNSTAILPDGSLGKGVTDVAVERSEDNDASRLEATHDGYVRGFGLAHSRALSLGNDGKEVRGLDRLIARGRKKLREDVPFAIRFHLGAGVEASPTADGLGALIRSPGAPPWTFRCRGAQLGIEESVVVDGAGQLRSTLQLVLVGEVSSLGGEIGWQFRRSS
ncbi:heparinase II/III family protein [Sphingomonas swuensis]|uniref:Heparinase II/III family protein n=1 Tax=Sphingomonas swuensis TaxID=977800 RepID=A0ABP7SC83_9SPHN